MAFCCEVDNTVDIILLKDLRDRIFVCDISLYKCIVVSILNVF